MAVSITTKRKEHVQAEMLDSCIIYQADYIKQHLKDVNNRINNLRNSIYNLNIYAGLIRSGRYNVKSICNRQDVTTEGLNPNIIRLEEALKCAEEEYDHMYFDFVQVMVDAGFDIDQLTLYPKWVLDGLSLERLAGYYYEKTMESYHVCDNVIRLMDSVDKKACHEVMLRLRDEAYKNACDNVIRRMEDADKKFYIAIGKIVDGADYE